MKTKVLLVLGMHRSGTSALTRVINLCGVSISNQVGDADEFNLKGHWESESVVNINEKILQSFGSYWDDIYELPDNWYSCKQIEPFKSEIQSFLEEELREKKYFIIKDPRLCRLLPVWLFVLDNLDVDPVVILPVRNPMEVARSLKKRNGFSERKSLILWVKYTLAAEKQTRHLNRVFISYNQLLDDWVNTIKLIRKTIDIDLTISKSTENKINSFLSKSLKHHSVSDQVLCGQNKLSEMVDVIYKWCLKAMNLPPTGFTDIDSIGNIWNVNDELAQELKQELKLSCSKNVTFEKELKALKEENDLLNRTVESVLNSNSWRITAPIRKGIKLLKSLTKHD